MASRKVASAYVDLQLQTAQFKAAIGDATGAMKQFSTQTRAEMEKSRESVRLLSEDLGLGIPRGLQGIISKLPGVTTAMNAAFDAVIVFALIDVVVKASEKVAEFAKKSEDAAKKHAAAWQSTIHPINETNDSLELTKTKLENAIAKLEHKPQNMLKEAIDEAAESADKLGDKLTEDITKIAATLKGAETSWYVQLLQGKSSGEGPTALAESLKFQLAEIAAGTYKVPAGHENDSADARLASRGDRDAQQRYAQSSILGQAEPALAIATQNQARFDATKGTQGQNVSPDVQGYTQLVAGLKGMLGITGRSQDIAGLTVQQKSLEAAKALADQAKSDAEKRKTDADAMAKALEESFKSNLVVPTDAQIWANPKALQQSREPNLQGERATVQALLDSGHDQNGGLLTKEENARIRTLLTNIDNSIKLAHAEETTRTANYAATAGKEYDAKSAEVMTRAANETSQALKQLSEASDRASMGLLKARADDEEARAKHDLQSGKITERQYQNVRLYGAGGTATNPTDGLATQLSQELAHNQEEMNQSRDAIWAKFSDMQNQDQVGYNAYIAGFGNQTSPEIEKLKADAQAKLQASHTQMNINRDQEIAGLPQIKDYKDKEALQRFDTAKFEADMAVFRTTAIGGIDAVFDEFIARSRNAGAQIHDIFSQALNGFNDTLVKIMTTQGYQHKNAFGDLGKSIFTDVTKTSLQASEGQLMKILGLGSKEAKHVIVDNLPKGEGPASSGALKSGAGGLLGMLNDSNWASGLFGGKLFGSGSFFGGGRAAGGLMSPGDFYMTGEQGPELMQVGSTSKINNARDTASMFNGGGMSVSHEIAIDARGSGDPAATEAAVHRAMGQYIPYMGPAAQAHIRDNNRRSPASRR